MEDSPATTGHAAKFCGAKRKQGGDPCHQPAGWGTPSNVGRCKLHGGSTPNHVKAASIELARRECATLGIPIEQHPAEALLGECFRARGNVEFYELLVQDLPTHPDPDVYVDAHPDDAGEMVEGHWVRGEPGIYGRTYHVSGVPTGEAKPHILVSLYNEERKHLLAATSAALKAGCDAKRVQIESDRASQLAEHMRTFAIALGHDPASEPVRKAFRATLSVITGGIA